jgi:hypothetical protein
MRAERTQKGEHVALERRAPQVCLKREPERLRIVVQQATELGDLLLAVLDGVQLV